MVNADSRSDWDITTVQNSGPAVERVGRQWDVVTTTKNVSISVASGFLSSLTKDSVFESPDECQKVQTEHQVCKKYLCRKERR
jgi:hypothetical protein